MGIMCNCFLKQPATSGSICSGTQGLSGPLQQPGSARLLGGGGRLGWAFSMFDLVLAVDPLCCRLSRVCLLGAVPDRDVHEDVRPWPPQLLPLLLQLLRLRGESVNPLGHHSGSISASKISSSYISIFLKALRPIVLVRPFPIAAQGSFAEDNKTENKNGSCSTFVTQQMAL